MAADRDFLEKQLQVTIRALAGVRRAISLREQNGEFTGDLRTLEKQYEAEIEALNQQLNALNNSVPTESVGKTVPQAQQARDQEANASVPTPAPPPPTVPSNADVPRTDNQDTGTNEPVRPATNTQGTPAITARPGGVGPGAPSNRVSQTLVTGPSSSSNSVPTPSNTVGAAAGGDDRETLKTFIDQTFGGSEQQIRPQSNVLNQFASYTYNISIYILDSQDYRRMVLNKFKNVAGYQLLLRSGGAGPAGTLVPNDQLVNEDPGLAAAERVANLGRNEFFGLDYYIDDLKINHVIHGKGTGGAHNSTDMTFKIIEPNGITLLDNLYAATQQYVGIKGGRGNMNYAAQNYLMVIRFYGYDADGRLITDQKLNVETLQADGTKTTKQATIEKFIPFQFTSIGFRVANRVTEYECAAVAPQYNQGYGPARGVIPYNIELRGQTLKDLFTGNLNFATVGQTGQNVAGSPATVGNQNIDSRQSSNLPTPSTTDPDQVGSGSPVQAGRSATQNRAPSKADAAPKPTLVTGLTKALNDEQKKRVEEGRQEFADNYEIVIVSDVLQNAKIVPAGEINLRQTPMIKAETPAEAKLGNKQSVANAAKTTKVLAGTSIVQFIDQAVRSSSYIYNQQLKIIDAKTGQTIVNANPAQTVSWFRIGVQAVPRGERFYDTKRNDFAYDITYQISPYAVSDVKSDWFPSSRFRGTHKRYDYWFTGKNTEILDLVQDYNYLFYIVQSAPGASRRNLFNTRELERAFFQPNSNQTNQGTDKNTNEPQANASDYLYSPKDQSEIKMRILGDPAWIQQGDLVNGVQGLTFDYSPFLDDGTISYESQDILFEVNFNSPVDYDLKTGIMDPGTKNYNRRPESQGVAGQTGDARKSFVYQAIRCTSIFSKGRFEQELMGVLRTWPVPTQQSLAEKSDQRTQNQDAVKGQSTGRTGPLEGKNIDPRPGLLELEFPVPRTSTNTNTLPSVNQARGRVTVQPPTSGSETVGPPGAPGAPGPLQSDPIFSAPDQNFNKEF